MNRDEMLKKSAEIRQYILDQVAQSPTGLTASVVQKFGISRQAVARYLKELIEAGQLSAEGKTKNKVYKPGVITSIKKDYDLTIKQEEFEIWSKDFSSICEGVKENVVRICAHGFTEIVNNAIDHSGGKVLSIGMWRNLESISIGITDDGVGIFRKIKDDYHLSDERQAILELSKGKLTTDPVNHSGQGIFFSAKAFNLFFIDSYGLVYSPDLKKKNDFLYDEERNISGTEVLMKINLNSKKVLSKIFDEFTEPEVGNSSFNKTIVSVKLVKHEGEELVSRSQAKRLMARVENFRTAMLDFQSVNSIGQAFADEIFRVYKSAHPDVKIVPINTSEEINTAIHRAKVTVLDGAFQEVKNVEKLIAEGLIEPIEVIEGSTQPEGSPTTYRIAKRDRESLAKILPNLLERDRQKIMNVMELV